MEYGCCCDCGPDIVRIYVPESFIKQCCPSYQKVINELEENIDECPMREREDYKRGFYQQNLIKKFAKKYLVPPEAWEHFFFVFNDESGEEVEKPSEETISKSYYHFFYDDCLKYLLQKHGNTEYLKLMKYQWEDNLEEPLNGDEVDELDISYPHSHIKQCFQIFEQHATSLPSKLLVQKYEKMKALYDKIIAAEKDLEEWFKLLCESEDEEFVRHNVELKLGKNLLDNALWKLYIEYLREKNPKEMLQVYSKYCRFFLDDLEMKEKYKLDVEKYGPVYVPWSNTFPFENRNDDKDSGSEAEYPSSDEEFGYQRYVCRKKPRLMFDTESQKSDDEIQGPCITDERLFKDFFTTCKTQIFSFQKPLMAYILDNANHIILRKLYKSCKYFYAKKQVRICYSLKNDNNKKSSFTNEVINFQIQDDKNKYLNNIYISTNILVIQEMPRTTFSNLFKYFYKCDAKYVDIYEQDISFNELKFLIGHGNVIMLSLHSTRVRVNKKMPVALEDIMKLVPNIENITLCCIKVNHDTAHTLNNLTFNNKINYFGVTNIVGEPFDIQEFKTYFTANKDIEYALNLQFVRDFNGEFINALKDEMKESSLSKNKVNIKYDDFTSFFPMENDDEEEEDL